MVKITEQNEQIINSFSKISSNSFDENKIIDILTFFSKILWHSEEIIRLRVISPKSV